MTVVEGLDMQACEAYDALASGYDLLTGAYAYGRWISALERLAVRHGLRGDRVLDVACGTGSSFLPLLRRGYDVTACDISPEMLDRARGKAPEARLCVADMRRLPALGAFDLVTCIDDGLNYLLAERELAGALAGFARNLADDGVAIWDLNTLAQYRGQFAADHITEDDGTYVGWRAARRNADTQPGETVEIALDVFSQLESGCWTRRTSAHRQRHWPRETVESLSRAAGLRIVDVCGQFPGAVLGGELDELTHAKAIYVARLPRRRSP
jgi:ubiquinone/menaquinone biosynthesis C-methylase UbiE